MSGLAGARCLTALDRRLRLLVQPGAVAGRSLARDALVRPHDPRRVHPSVSDAAVPRYTPRGHRAGRPAASPTGRASGPRARRTTADALENPYAAGRRRRQGVAAGPGRARSSPRDVDAAGDTLFQTYCAVCHGPPATPRGRCRRGSARRRCSPARARGVQRRLHLQHHPLRPRGHAALRRQGLPSLRPLGDREPRAQAAGASAGAAGAAGRRRRHPAGAERARLDRRAAPNESDRCTSAWSSAPSPAATTSSSAWAAGSRSSALILFIQSLAAGQADRAWQLFHVNWLYFTGLSAGSVAFVAVLKITNAKWSGMMIRFASAHRAFLPVSLLALLLIFTRGLSGDLRADERRAARAAARQGACGSRTTSCSRGWASDCWLLMLVGMEADPRRPRARSARHPRAACGPAARRSTTAGAATTTAASEAAARAVRPHPALRADLRGDLRHRAHDRRVRRDHGAAAALVLEPASAGSSSWARISARTCCSR